MGDIIAGMPQGWLQCASLLAIVLLDVRRPDPLCRNAYPNITFLTSEAVVQERFYPSDNVMMDYRDKLLL